MSSIVASGCLLDANAYDNAGGTTTTTTSSSMGGSGGQTTSTTSSTSGGGGSGGVTTSSTGATGGVGGATGGTGGTTEDPVFKSCQKAKDAGVGTGIVKIDWDAEGPEPQLDLYCDQDNMGGGWALVYTSYGKADGSTTDFWNIAYEDRLSVIAPEGPTITGNYYAGTLYKYGTEYRDDAEDTGGVVAYGLIHATVLSIDPNNMHFTGALPKQDNLSLDVFNSQLAAGWGAFEHDYDGYGGGECYLDWAHVTQHYGGCWYYSLGADLAAGPQNDHRDAGWGPHISNKVIVDVNMKLTTLGLPNLTILGDPNVALSTRLQRISRFAKW